MKILFVSSYLPYPLYSGGHIRLYNLIKNLSKKHEITLICEKRSYQTEKDIEEVSKICKKVITVDRKKQWTLLNVFRSGFSLEPFLLVGHKLPEMRRKIEEELKNEKFDLIHVETFYVMQNLPAGKAGLPPVNIPVVLAEHNVEFLVYKRYTNNSYWFLRPFLFLDVLKLKKKEGLCWKNADKLIAVSDREQKQMKRGAEIVPNGVDVKKFALKNIDKNKKDKKVLFIGDFRWIQNRDSAVYIIKNIWPKIISQKKDLDVKFWIVGKEIPDSIKSLKSDSVIFDENAPSETELIFQNADILLAPIRVGGGTSFKILESMSCGTPVLTTPLGNEGINAQNNSEIIICENPEEFAKKTILLLSDEYFYEKISRNGRKFVEKNFDWKNISEKLDKIYQGLVVGQ